METKSKFVRGHNRPKAKMTDELVRAMRTEYDNGGISQQLLAEKYGIKQSTTWAILARKCWRHVA